MRRSINLTLPESLYEKIYKDFSDTNHPSIQSYVTSILSERYAHTEDVEREERASNRELISISVAETLVDLEIIKMYNAGYLYREISQHLLEKKLVTPTGLPYTTGRVGGRIHALKSNHMAELLEYGNLLQPYQS